MSQYRHLTTREFLSVADHQLDDLTSTETEKELLRRLTDLADAEAQLNEMLDGFEQHGFDAGSVSELLLVLEQHQCDGDTPLVKQKLERADKLHTIVNNDEEIGSVLLDLAGAPEISVQRVYELQDHAAALTQLAELANNTL